MNSNVNKSNVVYLSKLLRNDNNEVKKLVAKMKIDGWCFVRIDILKRTIKNTKRIMDMMFDSKNRDKYVNDMGRGYKETKSKHHYKIITGQKMDAAIPNDGTSFNKVLDLQLSSISKKSDIIMKNLTDTLNNNLFKMSEEQLKELTIYGDTKGGLLDIVRYKPHSKVTDYVPDHVDPGLFSLNLLSNAAGLELYSIKNEKWVKLPLGYGAIFCGHAAKKLAGIPEVRHRVTNNDGGRFSIWFEVGVNKQLTGSVLPKRDKNEKKEMIEIKVNRYGCDSIIEIPKNATINELKNSIDNEYNIPMSKIMHMPVKKSKNDNELVGDRFYWKLESSELRPM